MGDALILACSDCDHIYEKNWRENCPRCNSPEYEIVDVESSD